MAGRKKSGVEFEEYRRAGGPRTVPKADSRPISADTYERLLKALEVVHPGAWRRAVDVSFSAINKTIDNEADALETIRRVEDRHGAVT